MPHLIETYALNCGARIDKPLIREKYFPLPFDKYITVHTTSKDAKTYDYFNDVLDIIFPVLKKAGIDIVQIGGKDDKPVNRAFKVLGMTNVNQSAYIIRKGLLHLGVDSFPVHLASIDPDHKIVALYSTNFKNIVKPYWGKAENQILLEPERNGKKPSFMERETPKTINTIRPEEIAKSVCKLLRIPFNWNFETVFTGQYYHNVMVETVPNHVVDTSNLGLDALIVRMDYYFNESFLFEQLNRIKCSIVTNKPINLQLLAQQKSKIEEVVYIIEKDNHPDFIRELQRLGIKYHLLTYLPDDEIEKYKLKFMEFGMLHRREIKFPEALKKHTNKSLVYKSAKFILSDGKVFPSRLAMLQDRPIPNLVTSICLLDITKQYEVDFLKEVENFSIMVDTQKKFTFNL